MALLAHESVINSSPQQIRWLINHACHIDLLTFKVLVLLLACLAVLASLSRLYFRIRQESTLLPEDWLVFFATICLIAETGCVYHLGPVLYITDAATTKPEVYNWILSDPGCLKRLTGFGPAWSDAAFTLAWIAVFSVKFSFLALFYRMVRNVRRPLTIYYWVTVAATAIAGIVVILESFILCPHFGAAAAQCFFQTNYTFSLSTGIVCQSLDIVTDLMIISIPILLLQMSQLRFEQRLRIAMVLSLSCVCVVLSIVRLAAGIHRNIRDVLQFSVVWVTFMLHCEAAVAVMTGSVPALRAIYRTHQKRRTLCMSQTMQSNGFNPLKMRTDGDQEVTTPSTVKLHQDVAEAVPSPTIPPKARHSLPLLSRFNSLSRHSHAVKHTTDKHPTPNHSASSSVIAPTHAYHEFQTEQRNEILVTYECTVMSEAASLRDLPDFNEVGRREWIWNDERPDSTEAQTRDVLEWVDPALLGRITSGMMA